MKEKVINLSNELEQSDGQLLDLFLDLADVETFDNVYAKLKEFSAIEKIKKYFEEKVRNIEIEIADEPNEYWVIASNGDFRIEVLNKEKALRNELDFMDNDKDKIEFVLVAACNDCTEIGRYKKIDDDLWYTKL